jgi:hypothetical protein
MLPNGYPTGYALGTQRQSNKSQAYAFCSYTWGASVIKPTVLFHGPAVVKVTVAVIVVIGDVSLPG